MLKKLLSLKIFKNQFLTGSFIMLVGGNLFNFGQFVYHFIAGRLLGKVHYGDLAVIISVLGIISIIQLSIGLTIVKFIASTKEKQEISNFAKWFNFWSIIAGLITAVFILVLSPLLIKFLNITEPSAVFLLAPIFFFTVIVFTQRSILQGLLSFDHLVVSMLVEVAFKLLLTVIFVYAGFGVFGATGGILFGAVASFFITRLFLSKYLKGKKGKMPEILPLIKYSFPVFLQGLALTSMYSTDLILVKHFFPEDQAGVYASLAVLGRVAYFSSSAIGNVMFPMVAKRHTLNEPYLRIFYLSVLAVVAIASVIISLYVFFPNFVVGLLYGSEFIEGAPLLWLFGVFMAMLCVATLFTQFYLSIGRTRIIWLFVATAILQAVLLWFIHPTILAVIQLSIFSAALLLIGLIVYFPYQHKNGKKASINHSTSV